MNNRINKVPYSSSGDNKPALPKTDKVKVLS